MIRKYIPVWLLVVVFTLVMSGCSMQPKFESQTDFVAGSYATITALTNTVVLYYQNGLINREEAVKFAEQLDQAFYLTKTAEAMVGGDVPGDPLEILQKVNELLFIIQADLEAREKK